MPALLVAPSTPTLPLQWLRQLTLPKLWRSVGVPLLAIAVFLFLWDRVSANIETSLGRIPGPAVVWAQAGNLWGEYRAESARAAAFYERQAARNAGTLAADPAATVSTAKYTGRPTYVDQILTSLKTVFTGFVLATLMAVPPTRPSIPSSRFSSRCHHSPGCHW
jgi:nitrate/nitrite transport system permease protein